MATEVNKFVRMLVPFVGIGAVIYAGCHLYAARAAPRFVEHQIRLAGLVERGTEIEALVAGNSLCCSLDWDELGIEGYELRHPASDLFETAYVIEEALPHVPNLQVVFVPLGFTALHWDNSLRPQMRSEVYATYGSFRPIGGRWDGIVMGLVAPTVRPDYGESLFEHLIGRERPQASIDARGRIGRDMQEARLTTSKFEAQAESAVERHLRISGDVDASRPDAADAALEALRSLARKLEDRHVDLVLFLPPFHESYLRRFPATEHGGELVRELRQGLRTLQGEHANVAFADASLHPEISRRRRNFRTCDHLSSTGAREFSRVLRAELELRGRGSVAGLPSGAEEARR
jgi:hypothetical protein